MLLSLTNRMACVAKIVKNRIRQQYQIVFEMFNGIILTLPSAFNYQFYQINIKQ
jgi:hypothetical protein